MNITLRQLQYLVALADAAHFGRAATAVNISQPALSVQIQELESRLGARLIERRTRQITLTPTGREVVARARRVLAEVSGIAQVARRERGLAGRLRIGVIPTVAPYLLPRALPLLRAQNIDLDLGVREAQTEILIAELEEGALDAAIMALPCPAPRMQALDLFRDPFYLAGTHIRLDALGPEPRPEDMRPEQLLLLDEGHCLSDQALAACALQSARTRIDLRASSLTTLCRLVSEGFGLTLVPQLAARAEQISAPALCLRAFAHPEPDRHIGLVRRDPMTAPGWFEDLAAILRRAATEVLTERFRTLPRTTTGDAGG